MTSESRKCPEEQSFGAKKSRRAVFRRQLRTKDPWHRIGKRYEQGAYIYKRPGCQPVVETWHLWKYLKSFQK